VDFTFTEEQQMLRDTVRRFVTDDYAFDTRKRSVADPRGWSAGAWRTFADMGLLGVPFAEQHGGIGGTPVETMIVMEELGRGLVVEPYFATVVFGGGLVDRAGSEPQKRAVLPAVASGERMLAVAHTEAQSRFDLFDVAVSARKQGGGYRLQGAKTVVLNGESAQQFVVSARTSGGQRDRGGITLFLVDRDAPGVSVRGYRTFDGQRAAEVTFADAALGTDRVLGPVDGGLPFLEQAADVACAALCAEAVGLMEVINAMTLEYTRNRQQFGQPISGFQVLQHRMVDMMTHLEQTRSLSYLASGRCRADDASVRARSVSAAKAHAGLSGKVVAESAIQLHGGMGVTNEMAVGHYCKRLTLIDFILGDADHHLERLAAHG
jgi:alkylation response protein AidB-like acyl-CoA dehydrogenase